MKRSDLIEVVQESYPTIGHKDASVIVDTLFDTITQALADGRRVELRGFGVFEPRQRKARTARNPKTGEAVNVGEKTAIVFRAGKPMQDRLNS